MNKKHFFKNFSKEITIAVFSGIIGTLIITWFITPITNWLFPKITQIIDVFSATFTDSLYKLATENSIYTTSSISLYTSSLIIYYLLLIALFSVKILYDRSKLLIEEYKELSKNNSDTKKSIFEETSDIEKTNTKFKKIINLCRMSFVLIILLVFCLIFVTMRQIYVNNITARTLINIDIVSPYIEDNEYKKLKSDFYTMSGKSDFDMISKSLQIISGENGLKLKE